MCEKCARYAKRFSPKSLTRGQVRFFAHRFIHQPVPLFAEYTANIAVEAELHHILRRRTDRSKYRRKGRRV
jgi:hypothetical protein